MSALPSPLKSPTCTSTQVAPVLQVAHRLLTKELPVEMAVHHCPPSSQRPVMSALPSPLKSPTLTSTHVAAVLHVAHRLLVKQPPVEIRDHHYPPSTSRPTMTSFQPS